MVRRGVSGSLEKIAKKGREEEETIKLPRRNAGNFIIKNSVITSILWIKCV